MPPDVKPREPPRFLVDHMLTKLGRYLRCLGYDVEEEPGLASEALVLCAEAEGRVLLTRNKRLLRERRPSRALLLEEDDPVEQLRSVIEAFALDPRARLFTRCVRCNEELVPAGPDEGRRRGVPERVLARYERFWTCPACGTFFWQGTHVRNTCAKLGIRPPREARP